MQIMHKSFIIIRPEIILISDCPFGVYQLFLIHFLICRLLVDVSTSFKKKAIEYFTPYLSNFKKHVLSVIQTSAKVLKKIFITSNSEYSLFNTVYSDKDSIQKLTNKNMDDNQ